MKKYLIFTILSLNVFAQSQDTLSLDGDEVFYKGVKMSYEDFNSLEYKLSNNIVKVTDSTPYFRLHNILRHIDTCFNKWYIFFNEQQFEFTRKTNLLCKCSMHLRHRIIFSDSIVVENFNLMSENRWKNNKDGLSQLKKSIVETKEKYIKKPDANELVIALDSMALCSILSNLCNLLKDQKNIIKALSIIKNY
jgi:hypothetical protein